MNEYREFALTEVPKEEHGNYWCEIWVLVELIYRVKHR